MNCSCTQTKRSARRKPWCTRPESGATTIGLVFWMKSAVTGDPSQVALVASQHRADARLVEDAGFRVEHVQSFDQRAVDRKKPVARIERAAALICPGAGDGRQASDGKELRRAVARARKAVADADIGALRSPVEPGEIDDRLFREAGDRRRPG